MSQYVILCVEYDPSFLKQMLDELQPLTSQFVVIGVTNVEDARQRLQEMHQNNQNPCVILCENQMPDISGSAFFVELMHTIFTRDSRKILLGQDTNAHTLIEAVNSARLDYFIPKPWKTGDLLQTVVAQATTHILAKDPNPLAFLQTLEHDRIIQTHLQKQFRKIQDGFLDSGAMTDQELTLKLIGAMYTHFASTNNVNKTYRRYSANHKLTVEGETSKFLWFVAKGEVVHKKQLSDGTLQEVMKEGEGAIVGLMSFVSNEKAFVSTQTTCSTEVIKLDREAFAEVMSANNELLPLFTNLLIRHLNRRLRKSISTELKLQETLKTLSFAEQKLIESEKMSVLGQLVAGVAHELNNPVAAIIRSTEHLKEGIPYILDSDLSREWYPLGREVMLRSMTSPPLSTSETRARTKAVTQWYDSMSLARKVVQLELDGENHYKKYFKKLNESQLEEVIDYLNNFYQMGTFLRNIEVCGSRIAEMVKGLKTHAQQDTLVKRTEKVQDQLEDTLMIFSNKLKNIEIVREYQELPPIECLPAELNQVWTNLLSNSIEAMKEQGIIRITTQMSPDSQDETMIQVIVEDNGPGIPQAHLQQIFDINYTTKREGNFGLGIGLTSCQQIVRKHQGKIVVESEETVYTRVTVTLPVRNPELE
ncbi:MAG: cyclic nucleotide-binding domain-containing protein [SAR324 cluster bacterium]|nr:cyclic nucleotide-binding domain-containing protein [SAR324 cluster bacterium]